MDLQEVIQHLSKMQAQKDQLQQRITELELQNAILQHQQKQFTRKFVRKFIFRAVGALTVCILLLGTNYLMAAP